MRASAHKAACRHLLCGSLRCRISYLLRVYQRLGLEQGDGSPVLDSSVLEQENRPRVLKMRRLYGIAGQARNDGCCFSAGEGVVLNTSTPPTFLSQFLCRSLLSTKEKLQNTSAFIKPDVLRRSKHPPPAGGTLFSKEGRTRVFNPFSHCSCCCVQ